MFIYKSKLKSTFVYIYNRITWRKTVKNLNCFIFSARYFVAYLVRSCYKHIIIISIITLIKHFSPIFFEKLWLRQVLH